MASHDDTLMEHVEEALDNGIAISEFHDDAGGAPCLENGMLVLMERSTWCAAGRTREYLRVGDRARPGIWEPSSGLCACQPS